MNDFALSVLKKCLKNDIKKFHATSGEVISYGPSFEDLGDYLPTLIMYGEKSIWVSEVNRVIQYLEGNNSLYRDEGKGFYKQFTRCYSQTDLVWGIILAAKFDDRFIEDIDVHLDRIYDEFIGSKPSFLILNHIPYTNIKLPRLFSPKLKITSSEDHGMYIEVLVKAYELTGQHAHLEKAKKLADHLYKSEFYRDNGFLSFYESNSIIGTIIKGKVKNFNKRNNEFQLVKQNSNALFGLYEIGLYFKEYMEIFNCAIERWLSMFYDEGTGIFYTNYNVESGKKGSDLTVFHIIELLILADKVSIAEKIANSVINTKSNVTGLMPFLNPNAEQSLKRMKLSERCTWLDSEVDFGVALVRLYQRTKNDYYLVVAKKINEGIENYHVGSHGFYSCVDFDTGAVIDDTYSAKMTALVSKLSIAIEHSEIINDRKNVYYDLLQDR
ncbi:conserved hypothetical protein [Vibrio crassostreae]|uniref:hypothetical protein n=1 Tax=Vibrio crassostreae TaxID=246167 RepID=UPI001B311EE9|nr:hypothetical protein [Vibrio crassostreae]CAK1934755.1 conserved hypothetical protein [Vibrio crassostreae]CAK1940046.1 conserved hypothetical protein [Vibrio crassostreae]CAK1940776.1 conserved hypothetical protein [Vibrio crassostreae]CAK1945302.1 conserved hypothetical protein [Vibrio crassostreae]CAK1946374.1 conserved hypothetical protein [Vibrio crassostreae]